MVSIPGAPGQPSTPSTTTTPAASDGTTILRHRQTEPAPVSCSPWRAMHGQAGNVRAKSRRQTQDPPAIVIRVVNPTELEFAPVPPRIWIVQDWLPIGTVTGNYGDGGTGKTLLSQLLQTSCATCIPWAGQRVLRCKSFGLYCEDAEEELHRRQDDINTVFDQAYSGLGDMRWISGVGDDWTLVNFTADGRMHTTERWNLLVREVTAFGARLLCLDTAADLFGGNENDRSQVRRFISLLGGLARGT